ncbi:MAG: TolC family protein [Bacteriovoracaceae bacterium]
MKITDVNLAVLAPMGILFILSVGAQAYTFDEYIGEVKVKNSALLGSEKSIKGSSLRNSEAQLYYMPSFFFNGQYSDDQRPTNAPSFQGTQTLRKTYQAGLSQQFRSGTKTTFSYNFAQTTINGSSVLPITNFYDVSPQVELTQSLWKNWWGSESRANETIIQAGAEVVNFSEKFRYKQLLMTAEMNYWRLAFAQEVVKVQKESLDRSLKLKDYNHNKYNSGLADESDYLQASSALTARDLDYQTSLIEERSAARVFNSLRELEADNVDEKLSPPTEETLLALNLPTRRGNREDVEASLAQKKIAQAQAKLGEEKNKPTLEAYGSYSLNGRAVSTGPAQSQSWTQDHPYTIVGIRFNTPLNFGNLSDNKEGYAQEKVAAELNYQRKVFEQEKEWKDLVNKFQDYQDRLKLSQKMEAAQKDKLMKERARLNRGRTTTFQILQFEQDYANAQLLKLRNEADLVNTYAQLKLFSGVDHE